MPLPSRTTFSWPLLLLAAVLLAACQPDAAAGDPGHGAELFIILRCAGCHGATAQGQFGPTLAGTGLTYQEVRRQVRDPKDKMPPFTAAQVSDAELADIYAWLTGLPQPRPTVSAPDSPVVATAQARDRLFPELTATMIVDRVAILDEVALRVFGEILSVEEGGRYSEIRLRLDDGPTVVTMFAIYDTAMARRPFPAAAGDRVILYGVGTDPLAEPGGPTPRMQVIYVERP